MIRFYNFTICAARLLATAFLLLHCSAKPLKTVPPQVVDKWLETCGQPQSTIFLPNALRSKKIIGSVSLEFQNIPLQGIKVVAVSWRDLSLKTTTTDSHGRFTLDGLLEGEHTVWTCRDGFYSVSKNLIIDSGATEQSLELEIGMGH